MKAKISILGLMACCLFVSCDSTETEIPDHAQMVRQKHQIEDSLRSLEIIEELKEDSLPASND